MVWKKYSLSIPGWIILFRQFHFIPRSINNISKAINNGNTWKRMNSYPNNKTLEWDQIGILWQMVSPNDNLHADIS